LDLSPGPIDGKLDPATQEAIRSYQAMSGEPVDGQPSQALLQDLRAVVADQQPAG
jgi:peptidoglycan hydrolase-like protein with peptidoglycan-binding domain